jgi:hypothetical protein
MSLAADARVVWGGGEAIASILALPRLEHCEDVVFGPKFSLAVCDRQSLDDPARRRQAWRKLARDVVLFEQRACSSPQSLFVEGDPSSPDGWEPWLSELAEELAAASQRVPKDQIAEATTVAIVRQRARYGLRPDCRILAGPSLGYSVLAAGGPELVEAVQDRTLFVQVVERLEDIVPLLSPKIQAIGMEMGDSLRAAELARAAAVRGVARCVPLPAMSLFDTPWDGMQPVARLVRWCRVPNPAG